MNIFLTFITTLPSKEYKRYMKKNEEIYKRLITLLKLFKDRPYHLAKYLIDNSALSKEFKTHLMESKKILDLSDMDLEVVKNFDSIAQMEDFYTSLLNDIEGKNEKEIEINLNKKLNNLIQDENYEEAAKIRDYMKRNNIKKIK